jgi:ABC-type sugar transport system substrate-binding protein
MEHRTSNAYIQLVAVLHGTDEDVFWRRIVKGVQQTARDVRVQLTVIWEEDFDKMAQEMLDRAPQADVMSVSSPHATVQQAVAS